jgi:peptidoglycan L-alanyl-D-glutamate endopeptidase CwlK
VSLTERDRKRLVGVNADLVRVVELAAQSVPLMVIEGRRTPERQAQLYAQGRTAPGQIVTWSMNSKHIDGKAVDVGPVPLDWSDRRAFLALAGAMFAAAQAIGVRLRWGGDWDGDGKFMERGESDLPHFELID